VAARQLWKELTGDCRFSIDNLRVGFEVLSKLAIGNGQLAITIRSVVRLVLATISATVAGFAGYQSMSPTGQWYGRTFTGLAAGSRKIALTYDDGPNDPHTTRLLEVLERHQVRATFFMIGRSVRQRPEIARAVAHAGHVIGNHTFTHPNLIFASAQQTRVELGECERALTEVIGNHSPLFRPPFGGRRPATLRIARSMGLQPVMWNVTGWDWKTTSPEYVEKKVRAQIRGGDVILLHDGGHRGIGADRVHTVAATEHLIIRYKALGYEFVTIPQMSDEETGRSVAPAKAD
jgi:peptidoglycan-N-acetylglucosamine deacetylase